MVHRHHAHDASTSHSTMKEPDARLIVSLVLNILITLAQLAGGIIANSLGLLSDAAHNLSDVIALAMSLWAVRLGRRTATTRHTFAYKRAEILVALFNSTVLLAISVYLIVEAVRRILNPSPVDGLWVMVFAAGGLLINTLAALLLRSHGHDLNLRSAFLHLVGDALTSLGVLLGGLVIYLWGWDYADAIVSILVSLWIGRQAFSIVRRTVNVLMEATPEGVKYEDVEQAVRAIPGVKGIHDLHIWALSSSDLALSAHIEVDDGSLSEASEIVSTAKDLVHKSFGIAHATLELETTAGECAGGTCHASPAIADRRPSAGECPTDGPPH